MQNIVDIMELYTQWQMKPKEKSKQSEITDWKQHWRDLGQSWRKEPEISLERQQELAGRREIKPDVQKSIYPFGGIRLTRADVEWLLATHENGRGPIDWSDEHQRKRQGLDLRGAQLQDIDLSDLPLSKLKGGPGTRLMNYQRLSKEQRMKAVTYLDNTDLSGAHLEHADLSGAYFQHTNLTRAHLQHASLTMARLQHADLFGAHLQHTMLSGAHLQHADLFGAHLEYTNLSGAYLQRARLSGAYLQHANLTRAHLERADLSEAYLQRARLFEAYLQHANLSGAHLEYTNLSGAHLEYTNLSGAHLEYTNLSGAHLEYTNLSGTRLEGVQLQGAILFTQGIGPHLADVSWGETHLSVIDWSQMNMLGDEAQAQKKVNTYNPKKTLATRLYEYQRALRATYQLATVLAAQGLKADSARFDYRARCLEQTVRRYEIMTIPWNMTIPWSKNDEGNKYQQRKVLTVKSVTQGIRSLFPLLFSYLFSWFLFLIAGYGYRLRRCLWWYLFIIGGFAILYWYLAPGAFTWQTALGESMAIFHGRGTTLVELGKGVDMNTFALWTVAEAFCGLVIEVVLVATAIQRFFNK